MVKNKNDYIVILIIIGILFVGGMFYQKYSPYTKFAISGNEIVIRSAPLTVNPGSTFTLTYTVSQSSGSWGNSLTDSVSGGCTFPSGSTIYKSVMLSDDGLTKTVTINTPTSGSCTFTGDYQFGSYSTHTMTNTVVNICSPVCIRPANLCTLASSVSNGCGGYCTGSWIITQLNTDDTNCDNHIDRTELGVAINGWIAGTVSRTQLGVDIQSWSLG